MISYDICLLFIFIFLVFLFKFLAMLCGLWDFSSTTRESTKFCTTRELPKIDFKTKIGQRRTLHSDKEKNPTRVNNFKHIWTYLGASKYIKHILTKIKREIDSNIITVGIFNTSYT